jgi:predicted alpha/beta-fold hydrolase
MQIGRNAQQNEDSEESKDTEKEVFTFSQWHDSSENAFLFGHGNRIPMLPITEVVITRSFTSHSPEFVPHPLLRDPHLMTIAPAFWPRPNLRTPPAEARTFEVEPGIRVLTRCNWQPERTSKPTLVLIHGLEGSAESSYMRGTTYKAWHHGMNVVRMNLRNCGGSMHLTPTLYNAGLSADVIKILRELREENLRSIFIAGYSLGGNIVVKTAGELGSEGPEILSGVAAVSPSLDLDACVTAMEKRSNRHYERHFLRTLKRKIREKAKAHPDRYDTSHLKTIKSMRSFDNTYTAPAGGYGNAANYYATASAINVVHKIQVPTLIIASEDDPLIPFSIFQHAALQNSNIELLATKYGGHAGYIHHASERLPVLDSFWAENRIVQFCQEVFASVTLM